MSVVQADIIETDLDGDYSTVPGIEATCDRCRHTEEAYGTHDASILRALSQLRANCPLRQVNYYKARLL